MARSGRKYRSKGFEELVSLPWRVSAAMAVMLFVVLRWIIPAQLPDSALFGALRPMLEMFSWIALCALGLASLLGALRARMMAANAARKAEAKAKQGRPEAAREPAPAAWSLQALRRLEWKRIEQLCAAYYEAAGFRTEMQASGPDGGIDVKLYKTDPNHPLAVVQCKAWNTRQVGVKEVRELLGVMAHVKVGRGIFVSTGGYTQEALAFGAANPIQLLDGQDLVDKLRSLPGEHGAMLLKTAFDGDYGTPTCPSCGVKLRQRSGKRGAFWGCTGYPRCKILIQIPRESAAAA